ncbi:hypothetical protein [Spirosoma aerolatum]|uniref:hypothetical protein n=1 Tax=Spirosoma aerolatum TaxID=1211326 RepID=UPI0009AD5B3C|nr:hypothetical protein [Spirosoma aerolatum]
MRQFVHFLRFFAVADDNRMIPTNALTPQDAHPMLPVVAGDIIRFLIPKSDLKGQIPELSEIVLLNTAQQPVRVNPALAGSERIGIVRRQRSEQYVQFTLTIDSLPASGQQFALMRTVYTKDSPSVEPTASELSVLGTVSGQFADLDSYIEAIQEKYEAYPHAPVVTIRRGNQLTVRIFKSARFQPSDDDLLSWRIGLGKLGLNARNTNSPALNMSSQGVVNIDATDCYKVVVDDDIEAGNVFQLQGLSYTAGQNDTPAQVLSGLGLGSDATVLVASGSPVVIQATTGVYRSDNQNNPVLQLLYDSNNGAGQDKYKAIVGADVQAGNIYQVAATGMTTKTVVATASDTPDTIAAQFNTSSGFCLIPAGQNPVATTDPGSQTIANTNEPSIYLSAKVTTAAYTVTRWKIFVGSSIQRGNEFVVEQSGQDTKTVIASASDTPITIAGKLGYTTNPFIIDVPTGGTLAAYARRGVRYSEPDDVAPVRLSALPSCVRPKQVVCEVRIPAIKPGVYSLGLRDRQLRQVVGVSNRLRVQPGSQGTSVLRWGSLSGLDQVLGYEYAEPGLMQQLRLPVYVGPMRQQTLETQYSTPRGRIIRTSLQVNYSHTLTTTMQPPAFHRALLLALKHPLIQIDGQPYHAQSDYRETEPTPVQQLYQAQTDLYEADSMHFDAGAAALAGVRSAAFVESMDGTESLEGVWLRSQQQLIPVEQNLTVDPAEYELRALCPMEPYVLSAYVNDRLRINTLLSPGVLSLAGTLRLKPGDRLIIQATVSLATIGSTVYGSDMDVLEQTQTGYAETTQRGPDHSEDFNQDYH